MYKCAGPAGPRGDAERVMAGAVGINTEKVDRYTFGLGCGIAGVAGSAFTMIGSTSPTAGQSTSSIPSRGRVRRRASLFGTIASAFTICRRSRHGIFMSDRWPRCSRYWRSSQS